ncbi:uncharacterized protein C15orf39 homolog [Hippocampus zosterae]|uniref:uncharacterized protein C15orf39 homolog n=1 Tax=Hippocampus zosterae TaxID=109293 RepID=UPI00223DD707|nr:uncharacterized protein C15orf39 homolog [Hippocampus zosterae]XP_051917351.1 uncharacterized protein C15orf39 homolog [Hippocampus zosterae]
MPLFDETVAFAGLSKSLDMSGFIVKPMFHYGGAHVSYNPREKDAAEFTTPWTNSSASLLDAGKSIHQAPGMKTGGDHSSLSDNPVYVAIPKALYVPCCHDLGCMMGHRYSLEHGQTAAPAEIEHDCTHGEAYHNQRAAIQRIAQEKLQSLQLDPGEEQVKRITAEGLNRGRPTRMEPNYCGYPRAPPPPMLTSLSEQSRHLRPPPRGYAGLHPSRATYEHMTSELYQECSPMSKYGHPTKHPMFYYSQANVEVESRTHCPDVGGEQKEDVAVRKSAIPTPREHYAFPPTLYGEIPLFLHSTETQANHSFAQGFGYPCYAHPGFHVSQVRNLERQRVPPGLPSHRIGVSPTGQNLPASAGIQKSNINQHVGALDSPPALLRMDPIGTTWPAGQSVLPAHFQMSRLYPSITSQLDRQMDRPVLSPSGLTQERPLDYSLYGGQGKCSKHPKDLPASPRTRLTQSPKQTADRLRAPLKNRPEFETVIASGSKPNRAPCSFADIVLEDCLKRRSPSLVKIKEEAPDSHESDSLTKRQKLEIEGTLKGNQEESPQMPVIDSVFSLAHDGEHLKPPGVFFSDIEPQRWKEMSEHCKVEATTPLKKITPSPARPPACMCPERSQVQMIEPAKIKIEKINQSNTRDARSEAACSPTGHQIKLEPEDATLPDTKSMLVIQICEPENLERKPSPVEVNISSESPKPAMANASLGNASTPEEQETNTEPKPFSPLQPPKVKFDTKTIPTECLKLNSTSDTCPPDQNVCHPAEQQETPVQIQDETTPRKRRSVRKHFLELHRALCEQISKCVSAASEQELRTWLSQLGLAESSSTKVQKVSCMLGVQARDKWLNKEICSALQEVLDRFREYIVYERCPFPHVMRTGAVFLPMLVVKEILFPVVPGTFIDQVLQEHKVELRPTTLSEEKLLTQLHKPCSSRLRRLMSLKHLPNVYADVINLLYYSSVCKHLGVDVETWEYWNISSSSSPAEDTKAKSHERSVTKAKSRVKSSSRRLFLDNSLSDDEDNDTQKHAERESQKTSSSEDALPTDDSWTHPLTSDNFANTDVEPEKSSSFSAAFQLASHKSSGMIVKLKRWQRTGSSSRILRPLSGSRKRKTRSPLKIKYCPYLSACHSAERRRRWVLRSAVRRASGALRLTYPDLVGKRIRHLYEEDDKSEVWYRGEVMRVHEAHSNPLKTIFEVRYDSEPEWKYYLELLIDYNKGWLTVEEEK